MLRLEVELGDLGLECLHLFLGILALLELVLRLKVIVLLLEIVIISGIEVVAISASKLVEATFLLNILRLDVNHLRLRLRLKPFRLNGRLKPVLLKVVVIHEPLAVILKPTILLKISSLSTIRLKLICLKVIRFICLPAIRMKAKRFIYLATIGLKVERLVLLKVTIRRKIVVIF